VESFDYSDEFLEKLTGVFKAFGSTTRLKIVLALLQAETENRDGCSVMELQETVGTSQANVSKHLKTLENEGLLIAHAEGPHRIYTIGSDRVHQICDYVCNYLAGRSDCPSGDPPS
jgi:DNA-binding transcriptional ArsR family regulator